MATWLKQSTAVEIGMGPFLDETDGKTAETALTITQPDIRLKKNGGAWAQKNAAQTLSHEEAGWYEVALDATDTNTLGILIVAIHEAGALPVWREFLVVPANVYDGFIGGTGVGPRVDVQGWLGTAPAAPTVAGVPEVDVTHWLGTAVATPTVAGVPEVDLTHVAGSTTSVSTVATSIATILAAVDTEIAAILAAVDTEIAAIKAKTDALPTDPADQSLIIAATDAIVAAIAALNDLSAAEVNAEVVDALAVDTYVEPGQITPPATTTLAVKIGFSYKAWRNKLTQNNGIGAQYKLFGDDALTVHQKADVSDDGTTFTKGEVVSGP